MYAAGLPPWVVAHPQQAIVDLESSGVIRGRVLDVGTGTGEHTILLARLGYAVIGVDLAPQAVQLAQDRAAGYGVTASFEVADVLAEPGVQALGEFDTVLDSALFHNLDAEDQARYLDVLTQILRPGGTLVILALAVGGNFGPEVSDQEIRSAFTRPGWSVEDIRTSGYTGALRPQARADRFGQPLGSEVTVPAWLALIRRS
nr:class I SAM-dependent methyltransferase [Kineosporia mesophila]